MGKEIVQKQRSCPEMEYKESLSALVKDVDVKNGIITGYFAAFGNIDMGRDKIVRGAFAKTIAERGPNGTDQIKHIKQHDQDYPIAKIMVLKEDNVGLYFESKAVLGVPYVDDCMRMYEAGVYKEHSIGYRVLKSTYIQDPDDEDEYHWELNELKLWEGSTVLWGMNDKTPFTGFKSAVSKEDAVKSVDERFNRALAGLRVKGLTDESYNQLEIAAAKYKTMLMDIDSLIGNREPSPADTHEKTEKPIVYIPELAQNSIMSNLKTLLK